MNQVTDDELDKLIHNMFDAGCEKATKIYDILPPPENELYAPAMLIINAHKEHEGPHDENCFVNRKAN